MRVDEKLLDKGWYFAISTAVFGNVINSSTSKCGAQNVIRYKEQLNKNKLFVFLFYHENKKRQFKNLKKNKKNI